MPTGHSKDDYTYERMMERRNRNNIRKVLERNGRRLTAREIDIVNLCTRHPDQRYTLFSYFYDANYMQLNPYVLPLLPVPGHHQPNCPQQQALGSPNSDRSMSTSAVAPLLFQINVDGNVANSNTEKPSQEKPSQSDRPSNSRVHLPCYILTDETEAPTPSVRLNSAVNLIADTIIDSLKNDTDKQNSDEESSNKGNEENDSSGKAKLKGSSRKSSKKKKKNKKKGGVKARPSETQIKSGNPSDEPSISSNSSSSNVEISLIDGDVFAQRVKRDNETMLQCFSSNSSDQCHGDVSDSNSLHSGDEGEHNDPALHETVEPVEVVVNEDSSALQEMEKADIDACIGNDFISVVYGKRGKCGRRPSPQVSNASRFVAFSTHGGDQLSTSQEKPSKFVSGDEPTLQIRYSEPRDLKIETTMAHESCDKNDSTGEFDSKQDVNLDPTKLPKHSRNDNEISGMVSRHSGEYVFKKDDFPNLPPPNSGLKEVVRRKVGLRPTRRDNLKKPVVPLPKKVHEQCKEPECEAAIDIEICISNLKVNVVEMEESGSGSGSSFGAFFSPDSSKSFEMNQSSNDTSGLDSPRSSKTYDETALRPKVCSSGTKECNYKSQTGHGISFSNDKSKTDVAQCDTFLSDLSNNAPTDIESSRSSSSMCSSPTIAIMPCLNIGNLKNMPSKCSPDLREALGAVKAAHTVYLMSELVQTTFGGPFANYELLCHYAAPIVSVSPHQIADVPLQKIWQWYEEPSCYALEVRGCQDYNFMDFTAHFVPSLSALQLFERRGLELTPNMEDVLSVDAGPAELIYEYFEAEQPYLRQPMFDKLKQLSGGVAQDRNHFNGGAHQLEQFRLGDLHPASWYCVAWYPAYRIPEGRSRFKPAFLTYHSLGHFMQGPAGPSVATSPVVGLVFYNTEELWFNERYQAQDVIRARLESLYITAVVMSRARVMSGGQMYGNHHPDFEFFASRRPKIEFYCR